MSLVTKRVWSVSFEAAGTLSVCHIIAKKPSNISVQSRGRRKDKLSGLQSLSALLQRSLSCLWAFSGLFRLTGEFPGFIAHGSVREVIFQLRQKKYFCNRDLAISRRIFASKSSWDCLENGESEAELTNPVPQGWHPACRVPTPKPVPQQDRSCHPVLL